MFRSLLQIRTLANLKNIEIQWKILSGYRQLSTFPELEFVGDNLEKPVLWIRIRLSDPDPRTRNSDLWIRILEANLLRIRPDPASPGHFYGPLKKLCCAVVYSMNKYYKILNFSPKFCWIFIKDIKDLDPELDPYRDL